MVLAPLEETPADSAAFDETWTSWLSLRLAIVSGLLCIIQYFRAESGRSGMLYMFLGIVLIFCAFVYWVMRKIQGWWRRYTGQDELADLRAQLAALSLDGGDAAAGGEALGLPPPPSGQAPGPQDLGPMPVPAPPPAGVAAPGLDPSMSAFHQFAQGADAGGPVSLVGGPSAGVAPGGAAPLAPPAAGGTAAAGGQAKSAAAQSAALVKESLTRWSATASGNPWWGTLFWKDVHNLELQGRLDPAVKAALVARGYLGQATVNPPDPKVLEPMLSGFEGAALSDTFGGSFGGPATQGGLEVDTWAHALPPDFRRAGVEIYRNIRSAGSSSVRHWLERQFTGHRGGEVWQSLWNTASTIDFELGRCRSDHELMTVLSTSDMVELGLRHLSAFVYENRTHDRVGAARLRAVAAPGSGIDIAPNWLITEATTHSKMEHQRSERVASELKRRAGPKGDKGPKGGGRGGK